MRIDSSEGLIKITLSKRNLESLLHKVDQPWSVATIMRSDDGPIPYAIHAEPDEVHYVDREPGKMHPATEEALSK